MASLSTFAKNMRRLAKGISVNADAHVRKVALAIDATVVMATPVDEGRARSNWQVAVDAAPTGTVEAYSPGKEGSTGGANAREAIAQAERAIAQYVGGKPTSAIHITNNLPYIRRLNDGWSAQAPAAFVERAVQVGLAAAATNANLTSAPGSNE